MSGPRLSIIPARAATDRALKPRDLQVLCVLGRHTDDLGWCRRSQVKMAEEMGCGRATVFEAIERLVTAGYLERHVQTEQSGRDSAHVYRVVLDPKHPDPASVREVDAATAESANGAQPGGENGGDRPPQTSFPPAGIPAPPAGPGAAPPAGPGPAPINDSSQTTLVERERERTREGEGKEEQVGEAGRPDRRSIEREFEKAFRAWPTSIGDSRASARRAWERLNAEERERAAAGIERTVAAVKATGRTKYCSFAVYLDERRWEHLPPLPVATPAQTVHAPPFGPVWGAILVKEVMGPEVEIGEPSTTRNSRQAAFEGMRGLLGEERARTHYAKLGHGFTEGGRLTFVDDFEAAVWREHRAEKAWPRATAMLRLAAERRGVSAAAHLERLIPAMEPVPVGSERWFEWELAFGRRGWPWLPDTGSQRVVYFPAGGPDGLGAFQAAVNGGGDAETGAKAA